VFILLAASAAMTAKHCNFSVNANFVYWMH